MALRISRIPLSLAKCNRIHFGYENATNAALVSPSFIRAEVPAIQRTYATVPAANSPAHPPAVQRKSEPKKGVMDFVLTNVDAVC
jgi:hypothetical protein